MDDAITEMRMRDAAAPHPKTADELTTYVNGLIEREHDYGTCVYAMSLAATAAFNFVAGKLGVTGFQASCADMDIIRRTRGIKGPFKLVDYADALYPQYAWKFRNQPVSQDTADWIKDQAAALMADRQGAAVPNVVAHWATLAAGELPFGMTVAE